MKRIAAWLTLWALASGALAQASEAAQAAKPMMPMMERAECVHAMTGSDEERSCLQMGQMMAQREAKTLLETAPTGAGRPQALSRRQVVEELSRARRAGELDWASFELGLMPR